MCHLDFHLTLILTSSVNAPLILYVDHLWYGCQSFKIFMLDFFQDFKYVIKKFMEFIANPFTFTLIKKKCDIKGGNMNAKYTSS
jgi:hypothetical protein